MKQFEVNRKDLVKFMINDNIDGLAEYVENLIKDNFIKVISRVVLIQ